MFHDTEEWFKEKANSWEKLILEEYAFFVRSSQWKVLLNYKENPWQLSCMKFFL